MSLTYEEFIDDKIVPVLKIGNLQASLDMHDWPLHKKIEYLTYRKEILYGIWSLENGGHRYPKNFYRAFANEARILMLTNHDSMDKLKKFQEQVSQEIAEIYKNPAILKYFYRKHEADLTLIKYHPDSYIKSRVQDYKTLYSDNRVGANRFYGMLASFQSEIWLLYQRAQVANWEIFMDYFDEEIRLSNVNAQKMRAQKNIKKYNKINDEAYPSHVVPSTLEEIVYPQNEKDSKLFAQNNVKSKKRFDLLAQKNDIASYYDAYSALESKVCFWVSLYKYPWIKYYKHYNAFRDAIETEISLYEATDLLPRELFSLVRELVDYKFEKVEFVKNFLEPIEDADIREARAHPKEHLKAWNKEITKLMDGHKYSKSELKHIKDMCFLRAVCILPQEEAKQKFDTDYFASSIYESKNL